MQNLIEWITGKRLLERWSLHSEELIQIIQRGLPAFEPWTDNSTGFEFLPPGALQSFHPYPSPPDYTDSVGNDFRKIHALPDDMDAVRDMVFVLSDVERFDPELIGGQRPALTESQSASGAAPNRFILKGDVWDVSFQGNPTLIKDCGAIRFIVALLKSQGQQIKVTELVRQLTLTAGDDKNADEYDTEDLPVSDGIYDIPSISIEFDDATIKKAAKKLWAEVNQNQKDKKWRELVDFYATQYRMSIIIEDDDNLKFKSRMRKTPGANKLDNIFRQNKKRAKDKFIKTIPELARHIEESVRCGATCSYVPGPEIQWEIKS